jgi:hypothetical protein
MASDNDIPGPVTNRIFLDLDHITVISEGEGEKVGKIEE